MDEKNIIMLLWSKVSNLVDEKISKVKNETDKTFSATVWKINSDNTYSINYKGQLYNVHNALGKPISLGQSVWVTIPSGILRNMFISGISTNNIYDTSTKDIDELREIVEDLVVDVNSNTTKINNINSELENCVMLLDDSTYEVLEN